jgi:hypothetical protein
MRVSLINVNLKAEDAVGTHIINQVQFFRRRGDDARIYVLHSPQNAPPDVKAVTSVVTLEELTEGAWEHFRLSDLYIYHCPGYHELMESIRNIDRGTVIFYYHNVPSQDVDGSALVHYADWCITSSPSDRQDLVDRVGYAFDRIHVLPLTVSSKQPAPGDEDPLEQYEAHFAEIVDQSITYTLPEIPSEPVEEGRTQGKFPSTALRDELVLGILTDEIKDRSDIAIRGYVIRSGIPLVGPLIAWARRNLTSHLREPYLDPMIERQVAFNHTVAGWMKRAIRAWTAATRRQTELEAQVKTLEAQVEVLTHRLNKDEHGKERV